jgi:hypothetical protein
VNSSQLFDQFISNIQEIRDIEWMFTRWAKGRNDHLFVLREHSRLARRHHGAAKMYREKQARLLDDRSSFPKGKYSPSESESANNICSTSSQLFISQLAIFSHKSHNLLRRYELNCFRINDTIPHLLCYFLEHFE